MEKFLKQKYLFGFFTAFAFFFITHSASALTMNEILGTSPAPVAAAVTETPTSAPTTTNTLVSTSTPITATSTSTASSTSTGLSMPPEPQILVQISQAKQLLDAVQLNYAISPVYKNVRNRKTGKTTRTLASYNLWAKDIALAILDPSTGNIKVTMGMQTGKAMKFSDPNFDIKLSYFNGVNSKFTVNQPAGGIVLALKYLIAGTETGSKNAIVASLSPSVYVPYSSALSDPAVAQYGADYVNGVIKTVVAQLQGLPSSAIPGDTITQAIPPAMIKALVYAEHTDTTTALNGDVQNSVDQLNILFATNQGDAYKYSVSTAGARGIAQFIPSTYTSLVQRHPEANLIPDFAAGMSDHVNSIKAMYLLLDDYAGDVRVKAAQGFASGRVFDYAAASYNGGTTRVANAVNTYGQDWNADHTDQINALNSEVASLKYQIKKTKDKKTKAALQAQESSDINQLADLKSASLKSETVNYLAKIYKVITLFNDQTI